ncbi:hypothetical protein FNJ84_05775 [Paracoccus sp. M683]|uniref:hypothetical protein n=1 Tax=Paracoccus sp. M683 TaxID=2594268 RepID=UPI001180969F|nr:hypothetical protein [Paracoccus sp. M683]TRW98287.1 hypothetical protein FNJ84_05775 [Paracoccus sp. M683]
MIGRSETAVGGLVDWLDRNRFAFVDEDDRAQFQIGMPAESTSVGAREAATLVMGDGTEMQVLVAIRAGSDFVLTGFSAYNSEPEGLMADMEFMSTTYLPWLALLRYRSDGAPSLLPAPTPGEMEGLWWASRLDTNLGMDMLIRLDSSFRRISFWPDGSFYEGTSPGGTAVPDRAALDRAMLADWGNYLVRGDSIDLTYADGRTATLERNGEFISGDGYDMTRVTPLPDGSRLDGEISSVYYSGFSPGSGIFGGISSSSSTVFHSDGRYDGSSFGGSFGSFDSGGGYSVGSSDDANGQYEIRDGLIVFSPANGAAGRAEAVFWADDSIMIGDSVFKGTAN